MKFSINKLSIWFQKNEKPQELVFEPNKVNVITGDSGAGKTNILAIIDYCFLSAKSNIVEQVINEYANWYSVEFNFNEKKYFIARSKTELGQVSSYVCFLEDSNIPRYPHTYPSSNIGVQAAKDKLDSLFGIKSQEKFPFGKEKGVPRLQISYRTFLLFNTLTERVITLDDVFLDFGYFEDTLFKGYKSYIVNKAIGFDERRGIEAAEKLDLLKKEQRSYVTKQKKTIEANKNFKSVLQNILSIAQDNNLISKDAYLLDISNIISALKDVIVKTESQLIIEQNNEQLQQLKKERSKLNIEFRNIKRALKDVADYEMQLEIYKDSLKPIEILKQRSESVVRSIETQQLINALERSLLQIKNANVRKVSTRIANPIDLERIKLKIEELDKEIDILSQSSNFPKLTDKQYWVVANIKNELNSLLSGQKDIISIKELPIDFTYELNRLEQIIDKEKNVSPLLKKDIEKSVQFFFDQLNYMGNYTGCEVFFNMEKFILQLREIGNAYPFDNIGSKSNYMFLHLCFFLGLHKYFFTLEDNHVLPFLFIDQPSIPYYAGSESVNNDDKEKLIDAFSLLDRFVETFKDDSSVDFQIILIEHAPSSYWKEANLNNFHLVEEFTRGNKLIPLRIINRS